MGTTGTNIYKFDVYMKRLSMDRRRSSNEYL